MTKYKINIIHTNGFCKRSCSCFYKNNHINNETNTIYENRH